MFVKIVAKHPLKCLLTSIIATTILSCIAVLVGELKEPDPDAGWESRGTLISKREMQHKVLSSFQTELFEDVDGSTWEQIEGNVQSVKVDVNVENRERLRRMLQGSDSDVDLAQALGDVILNENLVAIYKTEPNVDKSTVSILEPDVISQICEAETATNKALQENGLCAELEETCFPPISLITVIRDQVEGFEMTCQELIEQYKKIQDSVKDSLIECTNEILENYDPVIMSYGQTSKCPRNFFPSMVDSNFGVNGIDLLRYSSSIFITFDSEHQDVYDITPQYGKTDDNLVGSTYDTLAGTHTDIYVDSVLLSDMGLAVASSFITFTAMCVHTKSLWLTFIGILQLTFSIPLTYFVYYFIFGLRFFPLLNLIGVFVAAALGADGLFVAVDKWKNARLKHPDYSTEDVASIALPNAASAMFLTTSTTAVAFFATAICPVASIMCFALFCGVIIVFGYILNILFVFPSLCAYDAWIMNGKQNFLVTFACCSKGKPEAENEENQQGEELSNENTEEIKNGDKKTESLSFIHRTLSIYYHYLHKFRFGILIFFVVVTAICIKIALSIKLPDSADVRLLPKSHEYELHYLWRQHLLSTSLFFNGITLGSVTWGIVPVDDGARSNPESLSRLRLDETFNPSSLDSQEYLVGFCDKLFAQDFASPIVLGEKCLLNQFDEWLSAQASSDSPNDDYLSACNNADSLPMPEEDFNSCLISWSKLKGEKSIYAKVGKVAAIELQIAMETPWDAPYVEMDEFWNRIEDWMEQERIIAPSGVNNMFQASFAFWWYDTNTTLLRTAIGAAGIAVGFSAIVVLFSSRSFVLTLFSGFCIVYVLSATTASLVGFGWKLGFLESICFAILIGISCDFVIHFGHAYIHSKEALSQNSRSKYALIHMGPSILAASFTTLAAAVVMLFCQVTFFRKFALILLMTIVHATIGSFVVYLVFTDSFGPTEPTKFVDNILFKMKKTFVGKKATLSASEQDSSGCRDESS